MPPPKSPSQLKAQAARRRWWAGVSRDLVLFTVGVGLIIFEAVIRQGEPRQGLLFLYGGMVGLPSIIRADELRRRSNSEDDSE